MPVTKIGHFSCVHVTTSGTYLYVLLCHILLNRQKTLAFRSQRYRNVAFPNLSTLFCSSYIFWAVKHATCTRTSLRMLKDVSLMRICCDFMLRKQGHSPGRNAAFESHVCQVLFWEKAFFVATLFLSIPEIWVHLGRVHIGQNSQDKKNRPF